MRELATQFLTLAEKQKATVPLLVGHRLMGSSLTLTGDIQKGRAHYDQAVTLYDAAAHRSLVTRFGQDLEVANLSFRSLALWLLGYPLAAQSDNNEAIRYAREIGHPASLILALTYKNLVEVFLTGDYPSAITSINEVVSLAEKLLVVLLSCSAVRRSRCLHFISAQPDSVCASRAWPWLIRSR
jgi:hypothetical protein